MDYCKLAIIEDIEETQQMLVSFVETNFNDVKVVGCADSVDSAYVLIQREEPHIVLMDIQIFGGSSLDVLDALLKAGEINFEVIFITAFGAEYATKALQYSAIEFIHKPLDHNEAKNKLEAAIYKARRNSDKKLYNEQLKVLIQYFTSNHLENSNRIALHLLKGMIQFVELKNIVMLQTDDNTTIVSLSDGKKLVSVKQLAYFGNLLGTDIGFFRISQSIILNTLYIEKFNPSDKYVTLTNGEKVNSSRRGSKSFKDYIEESKNLHHLKNKEGLISNLLSRLFN